MNTLKKFGKIRISMPSMSLEEFVCEADKIVPDRPKCKCCGKEIYFYGAALRLGNKYAGKQNIKFSGTSFLTEKEVSGRIYTLQVCQDCFYKKYPNYIKRTRLPFNVMCEETKWAFDVSDEDYDNARRGYAMTENNMVKKYGEEVGKQKWNAYVEQQRITNTFEYKQEKYGWTREDFDSYNSSRAVTLENMISRWGDSEGRRKWDSYVERQTFTKSWDYMVEKWGEEEARRINSEKRLTLKNFIRKYGQEEGERQYIKYYNRRYLLYSGISQEVFKILDTYFSDYTTYYAEKTGEYTFETNEWFYQVDYYIKELNVAIEFNGDTFHANPMLYEENAHCHPFNKEITASQIWDKDNKRIKRITDKYNVKFYIIWESDWRNKTIDLKELANKIKGLI